VRRWERITASVLRAPGEIHESQLHRARKVLSKFSVLLVDDTAASGSDTRHREADDAHAHYHGVRRLLPWTNSPTSTRASSILGRGGRTSAEPILRDCREGVQAAATEPK
jgi:hypothetical protein